METRALFDQIDDKKLGYIDRDRLRGYCQQRLIDLAHNTPFDEVAFEQGFRILDRTNDGRIYFTEFLQFANN